MKHSATLYKVEGARKASLPGAKKRKKLAGTSQPKGCPGHTGHGCWPARCQMDLRMRLECLFHPKQPRTTVSICPCHVQQCAKNLKIDSHTGSQNRFHLASLGLRSALAVQEGSGSFRPSKCQGIASYLWPLCRRAPPASLHTGVSSATFFRSPAASGECWGPSEPSTSRIFKRTFWLVFLHSEYSWQWYRKDTSVQRT